MTATTENQFRCEKCRELREIHLHLHELAMFSEFLLIEHDVYLRKKGLVSKLGTSSTKTIGKWLRLASQLEKVELNPFRYEVAHLYCEPVADMLDSDAKHHESIATPLTRFVYVCNALEECYRFISQQYETEYELLLKRAAKADYQRSRSAQAAYLLAAAGNRVGSPRHYDHLVDNFLKVIRFYADQFHPSFDMELDGPTGFDYGLRLVRNFRNQLAHGAFPIIDDPEYTFEFDEPDTKKNILNLLNQASRVAAINIQMLLAISSKGFESAEYESACMDDDYGDYFKKNCSFTYLLSLHIDQDFGLNEQNYFSFGLERGQDFV